MNNGFENLFRQVEQSRKQIPIKSDSQTSQSGFEDLFNQVKKSRKPERSNLEQGARITGQFALGAAENALLPYELAVISLASKEAQNIPYRESLGEDLEHLMEKKAVGQWDENDQRMYDHIVEQIKDPRKSMNFAQTMNVGVRDIAEKITGQDLHPEGVLEKAANWTGFIKNPKKIAEVAKTGLKLSELIKAISPTGKEALRGVGAGIGLELAEQGDFGPIGTMAAAVIGDVSGHGVANTLKGAGKLITQPKKTLAETVAKFTPKDKLQLQKEIVKDFREAGLQADIGTLTDSNLIKMTQSRLAQSGLTGKAFDELRETLTNQVKQEYKALADALGQAKYATTHEAGVIAKEGIKTIRDADLSATRNLFENAKKSLKQNAEVDSRRLAKSIENLEKELKPGTIKSTEQQTVLNTLEKLKRDLYDSEGNLLYGKVQDLMNNKIALNDIINYEVQGGSKQLLKNVVAEIDRAIISHGKENPTFSKNYINANKRFSEHAKTFRNKDIEQLLRDTDPEKIMGKMNSIHGIRRLENILSKNPEGKQIFNNLKRLKLDKTIGDNLIDSTTQQAKLGTFSKLLEKGKNKEIIKEILGPKVFQKLEKLQKNARRLAEASQKFYNASKSGSTAVDAAILSQGISGIAQILMGNPWPLMKISGGILGARKLSSLLADPEFIKLVEDAILASEKGTKSELIQSFERFRPYILPALNQEE